MKSKPLPIDPNAEKLGDIVTTKEAARILRCHPMTLNLNRAKPNPIPFIKVGRKVFYTVQDLREVIAAGYHGKAA